MSFVHTPDKEQFGCLEPSDAARCSQQNVVQRLCRGGGGAGNWNRETPNHPSLSTLWKIDLWFWSLISGNVQMKVFFVLNMFTQSIQFEKLLVVNPWLWWFLILGAFKWLGTTLIFGNLRNYNNGSRTIGNSGTKQCRDEVFSIRRVRRKRSFYMLKLFPSYFIPIKLENHDLNTFPKLFLWRSGCFLVMSWMRRAMKPTEPRID